MSDTSKATSVSDQITLPFIGLSMDRMAPGDFWTSWRSIGIDKSEGDALNAGTLPPDRIRQIEAIVKSASESLANARCGGVQWWMAPKRMMS